jgi:hypothetical protein
VSDQWLPDRENTVANKFIDGSTWMAARAGSNLIREFWPEIRRALRLEKFTKRSR